MTEYWRIEETKNDLCDMLIECIETMEIEKEKKEPINLTLYNDYIDIDKHYCNLGSDVLIKIPLKDIKEIINYVIEITSVDYLDKTIITIKNKRKTK